MEKEIELVKMSSSEIIEKVAVYKDEEIIVLNQQNELNNITHNSIIKTDFALAILCLKGSTSLLVNNNPYDMYSNDLLICPPQTLLKIETFNKDLTCYRFCLSSEYAKRIFLASSSCSSWNSRLYIEEHPIIHLNEKESLLFCQYYNLLHSKLTGPTHRHQKELINALLQAFFYEFQDSIENYIHINIMSAQSSFKSSNYLFNAFIELLVSSYPKVRSVNYYASRLFVTPKYLSSICKDISGDTASVLITSYVMKDIVCLLKSSEKSIKEIANELNFENLSFFGKYVKRNLGISPKKYREGLTISQNKEMEV